MDMKSTWQGTKQVLMFGLGGLVVLFAFVNLRAVPVNLLFTQVELSLSLLVLISAASGMSIGWLGSALRGRKKRKALTGGEVHELAASADDEEWLADSPEEEAVPGTD
jgi:uncharacterized integral membrane protein